MQCDLFNNIVKKHKFKEVDLLDIDTEGSEFEILQSIDFSQIYIHVIMIENHYNKDKIKNFLKKHNFYYKFKLNKDEFYVNSTSKYANSHS